MKPVRWTAHALGNLIEREIERSEADWAIEAPDRTIPVREERKLLVRRFDDRVLGQPMVVCVVGEDQPHELVIVTVYKSSKLQKYLQRGAP